MDVFQTQAKIRTFAFKHNDENFQQFIPKSIYEWVLHTSKNSKHQTVKKSQTPGDIGSQKLFIYLLQHEKLSIKAALLLSFLGDSKPLSEILFHKRKAITQLDFRFPT